MATGNNYDRLTCNIEVTRWDGSIIEFYQCVSVEMDLSFDTLTDTATVTLPTDNRWIEKDINGFNQFRMISGNTEGFFTIGDEIKIYLGYNFSNTLQFEGHITEIEPRTPLKLICQDKSWRLKHNRLLFQTDKRTSLLEMLPIIMDGIELEIHPETYTQDITFDRMIARNISTAKLLENFRELGVISFMKDGMLCIGRSFFSSKSGAFTTSDNGGVNAKGEKIPYFPPLFNRHENVIDDSLKLVNLTTEKQPKRKKERDTRQNTTYGETPYRPTHDLSMSGVAIRAQSTDKHSNTFYVTLVMNPKNPKELIIVEEYNEALSDAENKRIQAELTKKVEAEHRIFLENYFIKTQNEYGLNRAELIEAAKAVFPKYMRTGMEGSFTTFGNDNLDNRANYSVKPAMSVYYVDPHNPEMNGEYLVKSVKKSWGDGGYRQVIEIPHKIRNIDKKA